MHRLGAPSHWWLVVLGSTAWSAAHLAGQGPAGLLLPLLFALGCALAWRAPAAGSAIVILTQAGGLLAGVPTENPAGLAPGLVSLLVLGLTTGPRLAFPLVLLYLAVVVVTGLPLPRTVLGVALFLGAYLGADQLRRRREGLSRRRVEAARLGARDLHALAQERAVAERARLVAQAAEVVRASVTEVRRSARQAGEPLDPARIAEVRSRAAGGVEELRHLLDLLRPEGPGSRSPGVHDPVAAACPPARSHWAPWHRDLALAMGVMLVGFVDLYVGEGDPARPTVVLGTAFAASLTLRSTSAALATAFASAVMAYAMTAGVLMAHGVAEATVLALLAWNVVTQSSRAGLLALAALAASTVAVAQPRAASYEQVALALILVSAVAAWGRRRTRTEEERVTARVAEMEAQAEAVTQAALAEGRARLVRDLHDVVGHALGVMVVQAGAAVMAVGRDPDAARVALAHVAGTGDDALAELEALHDHVPPGVSFEEEMGRVVTRVRAAGLVIDSDGDLELPPGTTAAVLLRVVQEAVTNALKHAPGAPIRLRLGRVGDDAVVEVTTGPHPPGRAAAGNGSGLDGLASRVEELSGTLEAAPLSEGGFRVRARVPAAVPARVPAPVPLGVPATGGSR